MKKNPVFLALLLAAFVVALPAAAEDSALESKARADLKTYSVEQLFSTFDLGGFDWSHDGKWFTFATDRNGHFNIWVVPATGGEPRQVTQIDQRAIHPRFSFDGKWIVFQSDSNGDEIFDVFIVPFEGGEVKNLTRTAKASEHWPAFSPDGTWLAYCSNEKDAAKFQIVCRSLKDDSIKTLTQSSTSNYHPMWSPDGKLLAFTRTDDFTEASVYLYDFAASKESCASPRADERFFHATAWSPVSKKLLVTSNAFNGFENVATLAIPGGEIAWLTKGTWPCVSGAFNCDGSFATGSCNTEGNTEVFVHNFATGKNESLKVGSGTSTHPFFSFTDASRLAYLHETSATPRDIWTFDLKAMSPSRITCSTTQGFDAADLCEPHLVHYPSIDSKRIGAFLYLPFNLEKDGSNPAIVFAHGGPSHQFVNRFSPAIQFFVNNGFTVLAPNYRGSSGYGQEFEDLNNNDWGGGDLQDLVHAAKFLSSTGYIHPRRVAIYGESYGGYLTLMALARTPDTWAAGVDFFGPSNLVSFFQGSRKELQAYFTREMGDSQKNRGLLAERSPIQYAAKIKAPLLVLHGAQDPFVPCFESEQIVGALKTEKGIVEYQVYGNEGHGFIHRKNRIDATDRAVTFLAKHLRADQD